MHVGLTEHCDADLFASTFCSYREGRSDCIGGLNILKLSSSDPFFSKTRKGTHDLPKALPGSPSMSAVCIRQKCPRSFTIRDGTVRVMRRSNAAKPTRAEWVRASASY